jgi:hypothetical protein
VSVLDPDRQALLAEWEARMRSHSDTRKLEAVEPGRYRYETTQFPYDGELIVLNVAIEDMPAWGEVDARMGVVEVELPDLGPQFMERHGQSYGFWLQRNTLYHDGTTWLSPDEWAEAMQREIPGCFDATNWAWIGILVGIIGLVLFGLRRTNRQVKRSLSAQDEALSQQRVAMEQQRISMERQAQGIQLTERSLALAERQTQILNEILEELRRSA